jgi:hypothetical protein
MSHSRIHPIPELDGHPNLEIPVWDGVNYEIFRELYLQNVLNFFLRYGAVQVPAVLPSGSRT